jgi:hypothetical protein
MGRASGRHAWHDPFNHLYLHTIMMVIASVATRDGNGFEIFQNSGNRFRNFSIGFTGNGIFRKQNRFLEFSIGISIGIGVVFYRPFPSVTGFCRKLPDLCLGIFRNCVSEFFFGIFQHVIFSHHLYVFGQGLFIFVFLDALRFFGDRWCWKTVEINDLVSRTNPLFCMHMLCISNI